MTAPSNYDGLVEELEADVPFTRMGGCENCDSRLKERAADAIRALERERVGFMRAHADKQVQTLASLDTEKAGE